jgi:hypothetical protein
MGDLKAQLFKTILYAAILSAAPIKCIAEVVRFRAERNADVDIAGCQARESGSRGNSNG